MFNWVPWYRHRARELLTAGYLVSSTCSLFVNTVQRQRDKGMLQRLQRGGLSARHPASSGGRGLWDLGQGPHT